MDQVNLIIIEKSLFENGKLYSSEHNLVTTSVQLLTFFNYETEIDNASIVFVKAELVCFCQQDDLRNYNLPLLVAQSAAKTLARAARNEPS
jgi:hypothetical protein